MEIKRRKCKVIKIGDVYIGGDNPIAIQGMTKTATSDIEKTIKQINQLQNIGVEVVRLAIKDDNDAKALKRIKQEVAVPLVADIHFDWRLALKAIDSGVDKIRLNPGNIYNEDYVRRIARAAKQARIPIRVGVNSGSLPKFKVKRQKVKGIAETMVKSALDYIKILEKSGFFDIVVSLKASNIFDTIEAYRRISESCDYPLHLGLTATGLPLQGAIKSSMVMGILLLEGIGDTIRISLTDKPEQEIKVARVILESLGLRGFGLEIISCPTCGRCEVDLVKIVQTLEKKLSTVDRRPSTVPLKIAIMGCVVNGPGEARDADIGIAFGRKEGLLFKNGSPVRKISPERCADVLCAEIKNNY